MTDKGRTESISLALADVLSGAAAAASKQELLSRIATLEKQLAEAQADIRVLRTKRAQAKSRCNKSQARLLATAMVGKYALEQRELIEKQLETLHWHQNATLERAFDWVLKSFNEDPAAEFGGVLRKLSEEEELDFDEEGGETKVVGSEPMVQVFMGETTEDDKTLSPAERLQRTRERTDRLIEFLADIPEPTPAPSKGDFVEVSLRSGSSHSLQSVEEEPSENSEQFDLEASISASESIDSKSGKRRSAQFPGGVDKSNRSESKAALSSAAAAALATNKRGHMQQASYQPQKKSFLDYFK